MKIYNILYFYISMFCTDTCHKQPLGEVLLSVEICFVTSLLKCGSTLVHIMSCHRLTAPNHYLNPMLTRDYWHQFRKCGYAGISYHLRLNLKNIYIYIHIYDPPMGKTSKQPTRGLLNVKMPSYQHRFPL